MSYSRWKSKESWYAFWHTDSDGEPKEQQLLALWYTKDPAYPRYTYEELKADREAIWEAIKSRTPRTPRERDTFDRVIDAFIEDVDESYDAPDPASEHDASKQASSSGPSLPEGEE